MEERLNNLENQVMALTIACTTQQETISKITDCLNRIETILKRGTEIDSDLYTYCKGLRNEIDKLKEKSPV